ncbi:MAG: FHA domain-containing protein [Aequorivita sp.]
MSIKSFIIGRNPNASQGEIPITVNDPSKKVSSNHCRITYDGGRFFIEDLISTNGTFVDGTKINTRTEIFESSTITLGPSFLFSLNHPIIQKNINSNMGTSDNSFAGPIQNEEVDLSIGKIISEGLRIGLQNTGTIIIAFLLWILTIWIPYLNIGTTIAMVTLPVGMSKGKIMSPVEIFESKYRRYFGAFFLLAGFILLGLLISLQFLVIPAIVLSLAWSQAFYLLVDKGLNVTECLRVSNNITYNHKTNIFFSFFIVMILLYSSIFLLFLLISQLGGYLYFFVFVFYALGFLCYLVMNIGMNAYIYQQLSKRVV